MSNSRASISPVRGGDAVRAALIDAAGQLLAEVGPRALSVRAVAERAGVNHGQVHHYFGGKRGLLKEAMATLAADHWHNARQRAGVHDIPPALSLAEDSTYWQATCRAVLENDMELAGMEVAKGTSVPRDALQLMNARRDEVDETTLKATFALAVVAQLGWVAFEPFAFLVADVDAADQAAVRERVRQLLGVMVESLLDSSPKGNPDSGPEPSVDNN